MSNSKLIQGYTTRIKFFNLKEDKERKTLILISILRFASFIGIIPSVALMVSGFSFLKLFLVFSVFSVFIFLIIFYLKRTNLRIHFQNLVKTNKNEIESLNNNISVFNSGEENINRDHPYSYDLDIFGSGSLFQYLNRTVTQVGQNLLADRLSNIETDKERIEKKQFAIKELSSRIDWRQNFMATGYACPVSSEDNKKIGFWLDKPLYFTKRLFFKVIVVLLPLLTLLFLGLLIAGISHYSWFAMLALLQLVIASVLFRRTNKEQRIVSEELKILKNYSKLINLIERELFNSEILVDLQKKLQTDEVHAEIAFNKLIRIIDAFDSRLNLFMGVILNGILMWDLYSQIRLERWKLKYGKNVKQWVKIIAEFDFYISMANFSYNNPDFIFPKINKNTVIEAIELGHPLIPAKDRVNNDFSLNKPGEIDIITGANMAGKSTFLRTIGVNLILAMNGSPVCAKKFEFRIMDLFSGMRTADSLKENESYFYAELKRLKYIVEKLNQGTETFVLLDEILKGTNSVDKAKGSWKFVEYLIKLKATGIVATHDLTLCELEKEFPENIANKCFEVDINNDQIKFDYKLRKGITQNMNATLLMKQMGIFSN